MAQNIPAFRLLPRSSTTCRCRTTLELALTHSLLPLRNPERQYHSMVLALPLRGCCYIFRFLKFRFSCAVCPKRGMQPLADHHLSVGRPRSAPLESDGVCAGNDPPFPHPYVVTLSPSREVDGFCLLPAFATIALLPTFHCFLLLFVYNNSPTTSKKVDNL